MAFRSQRSMDRRPTRAEGLDAPITTVTNYSKPDKPLRDFRGSEKQPRSTQRSQKNFSLGPTLIRSRAWRRRQRRFLLRDRLHLRARVQDREVPAARPDLAQIPIVRAVRVAGLTGV